MAERKCQGHLLSSKISDPGGPRIVKTTHKTILTVAEYRLKHPPELTDVNRAQLASACPDGLIALCAQCHFHARAGGHKLTDHTFADVSAGEEVQVELSPAESAEQLSKGPNSSEKNFENRNPVEKLTPSQPNVRGAGFASGSGASAPSEQSLKHDLTGRAYGHVATQHKIQMRVGLRFIVHLSKDFLTRTLCQTANPICGSRCRRAESWRKLFHTGVR